LAQPFARKSSFFTTKLLIEDTGKRLNAPVLSRGYTDARPTAKGKIKNAPPPGLRHE